MLKPDQTFGHFKIERKLGEGGMGAVFLAEDQKLHRKVALKLLLGEYFDNLEHRERFFREAKTAAQVTHANVMSIYDLGSAPHPDSGEELNYICMEFVDGQSLSAVLRENKPDMAHLLRLAGKIAAGLAAAHQKGIVHRDIKAENIIVDQDNEPRILDFGLAKPADPVQFDGEEDSTRSISQDLTKAGKILGTVSYMSPEQVRGEKVDNRSDIFSFGILLYQMATGEMPFAAKTQVSTLAKILESNPEPPHVKNKDIPAELERIITKCLHKDPADRYQDTRDLVVDLRSLRRQYDSGVTETVSGAHDRPAFGKGSTFNINLSWKLVIVLVLGMIFVYNLIDSCIPNADRPNGEEMADRSGNQGVQLAGSTHAAANTLAILNFSNKTGDESFQWLETGLPEIMLTGLAQSDAISVISSARITDQLGLRSDETYSREDFVEAARKLGAGKLLSGSYFKVGEQLGITAQLEDINSGTVVMGERVIGTDPLPLVDSLTVKIAGMLDANAKMGQEVGATRFAASAEAYKPYHEGMNYFEMARWDEAEAKFEEAIAIDSTFGLPYMRIGMIKVFHGKQQEGAGYFLRALQYKDALPRQDREKLDIYADLWQRQQFQQSMVKMERYMENYPDDLEGRSIYALLIHAFERDTVRAFAQFDTILSYDPNNSFALQQLAELKEQYGLYDDAIDYREKLVDDYPQSVDFKQQLAALYRGQEEYRKAEKLLKEVREMKPDDPGAINSLVTLYIYMREFDKAKQTLEILRENFGSEPFYMDDYYGFQANIARWQGKFGESTEYLRKALAEARKTGDNNIVWGRLNNLHGAFQNFDMHDSALAYVHKSYEVAGPFQRVSYGIQLVDLQPERVDEVRPVFRRDLQEFRERMPAQIVPLADALDTVFEAVAAHDTARRIRGIELVEASNMGGGSNSYEWGILLILSGQPRAGIEKLTEFVEGPERSASAWTYLTAHYYIGIGYEALGENDTAVRHYREMLKYWRDADMELEEIRDAKERLAKLTS